MRLEGPQVRANHPEIAYRERLGAMYRCTIEEFLASTYAARLRGQVNLIFTSPPFPLNRKKKYGNLQGEQFVNWLADLAPLLSDLLTADGSIVMEMGNAWLPGEPIMSTLSLEALLEFLRRGKLRLCQQFICYNPARLPSPAQWVNVDRVRVKDSYTHVWWMSRTSTPKANNRRVLRPYSTSMLRLLKTGKYNAGARPSEHHIGKKSFFTENSGAIPSNVLTFANTGNQDHYLQYCKERKLPIHPARMPRGLAEFFVRFLTDEGDLVFEPFGGSNTTGSVAQQLGRHWIAVEPNSSYVTGSLGRFAQD